jgi:hypothetical protein
VPEHGVGLKLGGSRLQICEVEWSSMEKELNLRAFVVTVMNRQGHKSTDIKKRRK